MRMVWKFEVKCPASGNASIVKMPHGARVLSAGAQGDSIVMWALVDPSAETVARPFAVFGTGHEIHHSPELDLMFVGTAQMTNGLVFHVFEIVKALPAVPA